MKKEIKIIQVSGFEVKINGTTILKDININFLKKKITCIIGPSGSGKSTLIRSINRINDDVKNLTTKGTISFNENAIYNKSTDVVQLRSQIGMVFQKPCVFPKSIAENVLFGVEHQKKINKQEKQQIVKDTLKAVFLWEEVEGRLNDKAISLSIGQQQRLCIARTLAVKPQVILLDEPTSSLDPISARAIEEMMLKLKEKYTIIFVTHNIDQAKRIADNLIFMCDGKIIEQGRSTQLFSNSTNTQTKAYLESEYCAC